MEVQRAIAAKLRPRLKRLELTLDNTLEELRRLAYARPGEPFEEPDGELAPLKQWPKGDRSSAFQLLGLKKEALMGVLKYLKHAGVYGQPEPLANVTLNNVTVVPLERLTNEELEFYIAGREAAGDPDRRAEERDGAGVAVMIRMAYRLLRPFY